MKKSQLFILSILFGGLIATKLAFADEITFSDLAENNEYYPAIMDLVDKGIVQGYDDGTFRPYYEINRVEALKIIMLYFNWDLNAANETTLNFSDIEPGAWYEPYLIAAYGNSIINGYDDGTFLPNNTVNLAETLKIISKAAPFAFIDKINIEIDPAPDVPADSWFAGYAEYALEQGAVYLNAEGNLAADQNVTRGQLADILYRFTYDEQFSGEVYYGNATYYGEQFEGHGTASGETLQNALFTAAHPNLPFGTSVRVTNQNTGATTIVKINDRGPYSDHAIIDLTTAAFEAIGSLGSGIIPVQIEIIYPKE